MKSMLRAKTLPAAVAMLTCLPSIGVPAAYASTYNEVAEPLRPKGPVKFTSVLSLKQEPGNLPQLRGGAVARSADWPASLFATFQTDRGESVCTAALVGPQAMLTAAHCVPASGVVSFSYGGTDFDSDCEQHPLYVDRSDVSADYALCKVRSTPGKPGVVTMAAGDKFERISPAAMSSWVTPSSSNPLFVTLTGYGCRSDVVADKSIDEKYRVGRSYFVESSDSATRTRGDALYAPSQVNNMFTVDDTAYANLCPGDSGGPAFASAQGKRVVVGVNSRVFYRDANRTAYGASLVSATGGPSFYDWALGWAKNRAKVRVCGIHGSSAGCM